jgi:hypothetical protein
MVDRTELPRYRLFESNRAFALERLEVSGATFPATGDMLVDGRHRPSSRMDDASRFAGIGKFRAARMAHCGTESHQKPEQARARNSLPALRSANEVCSRLFNSPDTQSVGAWFDSREAHQCMILSGQTALP